MTDFRLQVRKLTAEDADTWTQVSPHQIFVSDIIDHANAPDAKMTVGFARVGKGTTLDISFPYDEVLVLTKGAGYTVRTDQAELLIASVGEVIYLPAGSANSFHAEENTEMVYIANPPSVYANHVAASK